MWLPGAAQVTLSCGGCLLVLVEDSHGLKGTEYNKKAKEFDATAEWMPYWLGYERGLLATTLAFDIGEPFWRRRRRRRGP